MYVLSASQLNEYGFKCQRSIAITRYKIFKYNLLETICEMHSSHGRHTRRHTFTSFLLIECICTTLSTLPIMTVLQLSAVFVILYNLAIVWTFRLIKYIQSSQYARNICRLCVSTKVELILIYVLEEELLTIQQLIVAQP